MTTPATIVAALAKLDVANDNHWTGDGLPRLDTVKMLASDSSLTRELITLAAPGFTRASAAQAAQATPAPAPAAMVAPPVANAVPAPPAAAPAPSPPPAAAPQTGDNASDTDAEKTKPTPAAGPAADPSVDTDAEDLEDAQERLTYLDMCSAKLNQELTKQRALVDQLLVKQDAKIPIHNNTNAIQQYLASQKKGLDARRERIQAMKGIDLKALLPQFAPVDKAMARRTQRGTSRPVVPPPAAQTK